jgi:ATP-dependent DNA helicase DinG
MLSELVKKQIQRAYSTFLESKNLKPRFGQKMMIAEIAKTFGNIELDEENMKKNGFGWFMRKLTRFQIPYLTRWKQ